LVLGNVKLISEIENIHFLSKMLVLSVGIFLEKYGKSRAMAGLAPKPASALEFYCAVVTYIQQF